MIGQAARAGQDQALAGKGAEDGGIGEARGVAAAHHRGADMEMVAMRLGQGADHHRAVRVGRVGVAGQPGQLLQDGQCLGLERVELQRVGPVRHGRRLPFTCSATGREGSGAGRRAGQW